MNEKTRMVTLHKHLTEADGIIWQVELDGENTGGGLTQELIENVHDASGRCDMLDAIVIHIAENLASNNYFLTEKEKNNLNKLLQCLT